MTSSYSKTRVRVVIVLVSMFYFAAILPNVTLLSQYVVYRLSLETGEDKATQATHNHEPSCHSNKSGHHAASSHDIQAKASTLMLYYKYAQAIPSIFACLLIGGYADIFGRRPLFLISLFTGLLRMLIYSLLIKFNLPLWWFYIAHSLDGVSGTFLTLYVCLFSIVADVNESKSDRVFWNAIIGCFTNLATSAFTVLDGFMIESLGYFKASLLPTSFMAVAFLLALFFLPETLAFPKETSKNMFNNVRRTLSFFFLDGSFKTRMMFILCMLLFLFSVINTLVPATTDSMYQQEEPFCWSPTLIGLYCGARLGVQYVFGTVFLKSFQRCMKDEYIAMLGMLFQAASFIFEAFLQTSWQFFLVPVIGILGVTSVPIIRAMMSSLAGTSDQGAVFSSVSAMEAVCNTAANTAALQVYAATVETMPGAVYLLLASFSLATFLIFIIYLRVSSNNSKKSKDLEIKYGSKNGHGDFDDGSYERDEKDNDCSDGDNDDYDSGVLKSLLP